MANKRHYACSGDTQ